MLKDKRSTLIEYIKNHKAYLNRNSEALNIYEGNLRPYIDEILRMSLSANYYNAIKDRILPINILQRFIDKVSCTYSKPPKRVGLDEQEQVFVDEYSKILAINQSGHIADAYSQLFKGYAWEPYVDKKGMPALRELAFNQFLVYSDSAVNPEEETIFLKFMGKQTSDEDSMLVFAYSNEEFDAFYLNGDTASQYLVENQGVNPIGVIPFVYGKRQKNRLLPVQDSDMLAITKAIPVMLTDGAGCQMFQTFSLLYGVDLDVKNITYSPNSFLSLKSDRDTEKEPKIGVLSPTADTDKILQYITNTFTFWLETKGIRIGSLGSMDGSSASSGIAKIIDEMDVYELRKKSQTWFEKDEKELWNDKLPKIHSYWIRSGMVDPRILPAISRDTLNVEVKFEEPKPMMSRQEELMIVEKELDLGTMTLDQAIRKLNPELSEEVIAEMVAQRQIV